MDAATLPRIALVAEGPSDHAVLAHLLAAYFEAPELVVNRLQPPPNVPGGWTEVLRYCGSPELVAAFAYNDLVVIQIDTDVCAEPGYDVPRKGSDGRELPAEELAARVEARLAAQVGPGVQASHGDRILHAICVDSLECWLLPLYYNDGRREKTANCLRTLNAALSAREGYSIDEHSKQVQYYERLLRQHKCHKRKTLAALAAAQPGVARFVRQLDLRFPARAMLGA